MVTENVPTEGDDIPAPSMTVLTVKENIDVQYYSKKAKECLDKSNAMECIENIGDKKEDLFMLPMIWSRYFGVYGGWQYHRKINLTMNNINRDVPLGLMNNNTKLQVFIHDENEIINNLSELKVTVLSKDSVSVYIKVHKIQKVKECEDDPLYSFSKCVEKFVEKVSLVFKSKIFKPKLPVLGSGM